jgi:hypothetical protein
MPFYNFTRSRNNVMCSIQHTASSAPSDFYCVEGGWIEARTIATFALAVNGNNVMCLIQHCFICGPSDFLRCGRRLGLNPVAEFIDPLRELKPAKKVGSKVDMTHTPL